MFDNFLIYATINQSWINDVIRRKRRSKPVVNSNMSFRTEGQNPVKQPSAIAAEASLKHPFAAGGFNSPYILTYLHSYILKAKGAWPRKLFMQNKPIFKTTQIAVSNLSKTGYW